MEKHATVIKGRVNRKLYSYDKGWGIYSNNEHVGTKTIWSGELNVPYLNDGELLYIEEIDTTVQIKARVRSTTGETVYLTSHEAEIIEDEITQKSKENAEALLQEYTDEKNPIKNTSWISKFFK